MASDGQYTVTNLPPGVYTVTVSASGFVTKAVRDVRLLINQTARVDVPLTLGTVSSRVEVEATAPVVQSETSSIGQIVTSWQVTQMPLDGHGNIFSLLALAPGVMSAGQNPVIGGGVWFGSINSGPARHSSWKSWRNYRGQRSERSGNAGNGV